MQTTPDHPDRNMWVFWVTERCVCVCSRTVIGSKRSIRLIRRCSPILEFWEVASRKLKIPSSLHSVCAHIPRKVGGLCLHTTGHKVNIKTEECWKSNKCKHLRRPPTISPICISHVCLLTHYKGLSCSLFTHQVFPSPPFVRTRSEQTSKHFISRTPAFPDYSSRGRARERVTYVQVSARVLI